MRKVLAIDQDYVVAKLLSKWLDHYNKDYNDNLTVDDLVDWDVSLSVKPECGDKIYDYLSLHKFYRDLEVVENSQETIKELSKHYDIFFVTDAMFNRMSFKSKFDWLREHFPFIPKDNIVFCGNKSIIKADYLIDDGLHNLEGFQGHGILFDAPYNRKDQRFFRGKDWGHIGDVLINKPQEIEKFYLSKSET